MSAELVQLAAEEAFPEDEQIKPKDSDLENEVGAQLNMPFSTYWKDGSHEILRGEDEGPTVRQLVAMRRTDGQARALYRLITLPIRSALEHATYGMDSEEDEAETETEFVQQMLTLPSNGGGMQTPFQKVMAQMLMAVFDGFAAFEQVYWVPEKGPLKGKVTLKKIAHRPSETITFLVDDHGDFNGLRQRTIMNAKTFDIEIPPETALYVAMNEEERRYYGVSYFQSAFYHYDKKVKLYFVAHLAAQRAAVGTRKGTLPKTPTPKDKAAFLKALGDLGVAQWISLPDGYDVELLTEQTTFDFLSYINHHNSQMSKSVLAAFFDSSQGGGAADTSLVNFGEQSDAMFMLMLQAIMDEIASVINNEIIPKFIDWNFGSGKYPKFKWGAFTDEQKKAINTIFEKLSSGGQPNTTPQFLRELEKYVANELGLTIDYEAIEAEEEALKAANEAAMGQLEAGDPNAPLLDENGQPVDPDDPEEVAKAREAQPPTGTPAALPPGAVPTPGPPPPAAPVPGAPVAPRPGGLVPPVKKKPVGKVALSALEELAGEIITAAGLMDPDA